MKKVLLLSTLSLAIMLNGCKDESLDVKTVDQASTDIVPAIVVQAVKNEYPSATDVKFSVVEKNKVWESQFSYQTQTHEAKIDSKGTILEVYAIAGTATLPAAIEEYIAKNFAGYKVVTTSEGKNGTQKAYKVILKNEKEEVTLLFDENGKLIADFRATTPAVTPPEPPKNYPVLKADELPAAILQYLKDQGLTFAKGMVNIEKDKKNYSVTATKGTTVYTLNFDENGKLTRSSSYTPPPAPVVITSLNDLPKIIVDALAGYKFEKGTITTEKDKKTYYIVVSKEGRTYEFVFDNDGKILKSSVPPPSPQKIERLDGLPATIIAALAGYTFESGVISFDNTGKKSYSIVASKEGKRYEFLFDNDGKLVKSTVIAEPVKTEQKVIVEKELPQSIIEYLTKNYAGWRLEKATLTTVNGEKSEYLVYIKVGNDGWYVTFDGKGVFRSAKKG